MRNYRQIIVSITLFFILYNPLYAQNTWTTKADMPTARFNFPSSEVNGKIYAFGGYRNGSPLSIVEEYDPATEFAQAQAPTKFYYLNEYYKPSDNGDYGKTLNRLIQTLKNASPQGGTILIRNVTDHVPIKTPVTLSGSNITLKGLDGIFGTTLRYVGDNNTAVVLEINDAHFFSIENLGVFGKYGQTTNKACIQTINSSFGSFDHVNLAFARRPLVINSYSSNFFINVINVAQWSEVGIQIEAIDAVQGKPNPRQIIGMILEDVAVSGQYSCFTDGLPNSNCGPQSGQIAGILVGGGASTVRISRSGAMQAYYGLLVHRTVTAIDGNPAVPEIITVIGFDSDFCSGYGINLAEGHYFNATGLYLQGFTQSAFYCGERYTNVMVSNTWFGFGSKSSDFWQGGCTPLVISNSTCTDVVNNVTIPCSTP